ncbi:MAG: methionyl-tRNA formyltransferase [Candidatus Microsaccharimonas sp.]
MTNTSKTVLFFGTDSFSASALQALIYGGYNIGAVITKPDSKQGRGQQLTAPIVKTIAEKNGIPVWQPLRLADITEDVKAFGSVVGVLSSYGKIVPQSIIDLFEPGIINIHPSLLPRYRGPSPIETAILNGDNETGVTIMKLEAGMDSGPIYAQETYPLKGTETQPELYDALSRFGAELLVKTLPKILSGEIRPLVQVGEAVYCHLLRKEDALVDASRFTAAEIERRVRAYLTFPKTKLILNGQTVTITKSHVSTERTSLLDQTCKDGQFLVIDQLVGPSGRQMSGKDFLNGYAAG